MSLEPLPACRHRGAWLGGDEWQCASPKIVAPAGRVTGEMCRRQCPYVDHPPDPRFSAVADGPAAEEASPVLVRVRPGRVAAAMLTAPRPTPLVDESLRQLRQGGFSQAVHVFAEPGAAVTPAEGVCVHTHAERQGAWGNFRYAAEWLLAHTPAPFLLVCEDDLLVAPDAAAGLAHALQTLPTDGLGYLSLYTPWHNVQGQRLVRGWQALRVGAATRGALAYCFSRESLGLVLAGAPPADPRRLVHADQAISALFGARGRKCYFHAPSLIEHAGKHVSTLGHNNLAGSDAVDFRPDARRYAAEPEAARVRTGRGEVFALTSLSPDPQTAPHTRQCLASWRRAGLHVRAFQHPSEIPALQRQYDVEFVPVERTSQAVFGRRFIPVHVLLEWAARADAAALILNSDIELRLAPWELQRIRWLSEGGLAYFVRHNHDGDPARADPEPFGIDGFLLHGRDAGLCGESFLSLGRPAWDYWLPQAFVAAGRPLLPVVFPAALHLRHPQRWSTDDWRICSQELFRVLGRAAPASLPSCANAMIALRRSFDRRPPLAARPFAIRPWLEARLGDRRPKTILELGAHDGRDTAWLAALPGAVVHAFEPDPRNVPPPRNNVTLHRAAIADRDGRRPLLLSRDRDGRPWTQSSSLLRPKRHLERFPVTFGETVEVEAVTLDTFRRRAGLGSIDFIWADVQGAEGDLIRGGRETLADTRYLYTEYSDEELYEGQPTLAELLALLPQFRVVELWEEDVLLENTALP